MRNIQDDTYDLQQPVNRNTCTKQKRLQILLSTYHQQCSIHVSSSQSVVLPFAFAVFQGHDGRNVQMPRNAVSFVASSRLTTKPKCKMIFWMWSYYFLLHPCFWTINLICASTAQKASLSRVLKSLLTYNYWHYHDMFCYRVFGHFCSSFNEWFNLWQKIMLRRTILKVNKRVGKAIMPNVKKHHDFQFWSIKFVKIFIFGEVHKITTIFNFPIVKAKSISIGKLRALMHNTDGTMLLRKCVSIRLN